MAGVTGHASGVIGSGNLGEGFGLGAIGFVATAAEDEGVELRGSHGGGIVGVAGLGSMAGFAGNDHMLALLFLIHYVGVAGFAGVVAGEGDGAGGDLGDGCAPIVTVLAKGAGHDGGAQDDECHQRDQHHGGEPDEMFDVLEQAVFLRRAAGANWEKAQCSWITGIRAGNDD